MTQPARQLKTQLHGERTPRSRMIAAIHIKFKQARKDLRFSTEAEIRDERLAFITDALRLKKPLNSMRSLTDRQLGLVLDALKRYEAQPALPNSQAAPAAKPESAEVIHLASAEQVHTINKLLDFLGWGLEARASFIKKRFKRSGPAMLSPQQAQSLTMILLNIAAARSVKERTGVARVSRVAIHKEIPELKVRLGIDRKANNDSEEVAA